MNRLERLKLLDLIYKSTFDESLARIEHPGDPNYKIGDSAKLKDVEFLINN